MALRVLYVLNDLGGGASQGIYEWLASGAREDILPYAVAPPGRPEQVARARRYFEGLRTVPLPWWNRPVHLGVARRLAIAVGRLRRGDTQARSVHHVLAAIRDWEIDVVHSVTAVTLSGALAAGRAGVPHVWHIKECIGSRGRVQFPLSDKNLATLIRHRSAEVVVMSRFIGQFFDDQGYHDYVVLPDGVDLAPYAQGQSRNLRDRLGLGADELLVGMVASMASTWKEHGVFIEAARRTLARCPRVRFVMIGPRPRRSRWPHDHAWDYYQSLERQAGETVAEGRFVFADFVPDPPDIMRSLDVLVHTCRTEPFGRVAIEAMAAGTPVVGPTTGGIAETVAAGRTGLLVTPGDPEAFATAIQRLAEDRGLRARLAEAGPEHVRSSYSIGHYVATQTEVYRRALAGRPEAELSR